MGPLTIIFSFRKNSEDKKSAKIIELSINSCFRYQIWSFERCCVFFLFVTCKVFKGNFKTIDSRSCSNINLFTCCLSLIGFTTKPIGLNLRKKLFLSNLKAHRNGIFILHIEASRLLSVNNGTIWSRVLDINLWVVRDLQSSIKSSQENNDSFVDSRDCEMKLISVSLIGNLEPRLFVSANLFLYKVSREVRWMDHECVASGRFLISVVQESIWNMKRDDWLLSSETGGCGKSQINWVLLTCLEDLGRMV